MTFPSAISLQGMELQPDYSVTLIPDHLVTEKASTIVLYLQDDIPVSVRTVTVELRHMTSGKLEFLVAVKLGQDALLLRVPEIKQAGELEGTIKLDGRTSLRYLPFALPVLTPLDTLFHNSIKKGKQRREVRNSKAVLASTVAYLTTLKTREADKEANADLLLERVFKIQGSLGKKVPVMVRDICAGKQTSEESLLHFALRHRLLKLVDYLLEGAESPVNKRQLISTLDQESFDYLTAQFLAKANYPDILPKLNQMYKDEIGGQIKKKPPQPTHDTRRRRSRLAEIKTFVSLTRRRSSAAKSTAVSRPVSAVLDERKRSTSWNDIASHLTESDSSQALWAQLQQRTGKEPKFRSFSVPADSDSEEDEYIKMHPEKIVTANPMVQARKVSLSMDRGLNLLLSNRPLPDIPSEEDSDETGSQSNYDVPRHATSPEGHLEAIYDIPRPGAHPAAEDMHGKFQTNTPNTQLKAWSQSELHAECSADKESGSEEEQDPNPPTTTEDMLDHLAAVNIPPAAAEKEEEETRAVVKFI